MKRLYESVIKKHLEEHELMAFICGPRQVGKTTIAQEVVIPGSPTLYVNWDNLDDRIKILEGPRSLVEGILLSTVSEQCPILILDEIHKYEEWQTFVKGIYDTYKNQIKIIVTGSARLKAYRRGGDSMMGRYFLYRMHPLSIGELAYTERSGTLMPPKKVPDEQVTQLLDLGGFPRPFISGDPTFARRWRGLRHQQLMTQDLRDISDIKLVSRLEVLARLVAGQTGQLFNYSSMAKKIRVSDQTVRQWMDTLEELYYCFKIHPWSKNIERSLLKTPKYYLWDWSGIEDPGARYENFVASHLLKAVHFWTDSGLGEYELFYIRDKDQKEVDFLIVENSHPWILIETKCSEKKSLSKSLMHFYEQLKPQYCIQLAQNMPYVEFDVRELDRPKIVPMSTFLSQLV